MDSSADRPATPRARVSLNTAKAIRALAWMVLALWLYAAIQLEAQQHPPWRYLCLLSSLMLGGFSLTGRWLIGGYCGALAYVATSGSSWMKLSLLREPLTIGDLRDTSLAEVIEMVHHYPLHAAVMLILIAAMLALAAWLLSQARAVRARWRFTALLLTGSALATAANGLADFEYANIQSNSSGVLNFLATYYSHPPRLSSPLPAAPQNVVQECPKNPPNIVLVLQESTFRPSTDEVAAMGEGRRFFDGNVFAGPLHVHVVGGMTHASEFAVLTGLPHLALDGKNSYPQGTLAGKLNHSLVHQLRACGYTTSVLYPTLPDFRNSEVWYQGLGFEHRVSGRDMDLKDWYTPDKTFFDTALSHWQTLPSDRPHLIYLLTIAQHGPHDTLNARADYLRRLNESATAWAGFRQTLTERAHQAGERPTLLAWFGDHRPLGVGVDGDDRQTTWGVIDRLGPNPPAPTPAAPRRAPKRGTLIEQALTSSPATLLASSRPQAVPPGQGPQGTPLDLAYFGHQLLQQAGVRLQPTYPQQAALAAACPQAYLSCPVTQRAAYQRTLLDIGAFPQ